MPLYEFQCQKCNEIMEKTMKMSDPAPEVCEQCGGGPLTKLISPAAFHLKGGGWYKDSYDSKSNKKPEAPKAKPEKKEAPPAPKADS